MLVTESFVAFRVFRLVEGLNNFTDALIIFDGFEHKSFKLLGLNSSVPNLDWKFAGAGVFHKKVNAIKAAHDRVWHFIQSKLIQCLRLHEIHMDCLMSVHIIDEKPILN